MRDARHAALQAFKHCDRAEETIKAMSRQQVQRVARVVKYVLSGTTNNSVSINESGHALVAQSLNYTRQSHTGVQYNFKTIVINKHGDMIDTRFELRKMQAA